jgi:hypothetical protein
MRKSRGFCGRLLRRPHQAGTRFVKGQPNGVRPSTSAPYHRHHVGKRDRNRGGTVPGNRQGIRRYSHAIAPTRSERPQKQVGNRRIPRPSLWSGEAALHGVYVLPCASSVVRLARTLRPGRTRMVVSPLANLTRSCPWRISAKSPTTAPVSDPTVPDLGDRRLIRDEVDDKAQAIARARAEEMCTQPPGS